MKPKELRKMFRLEINIHFETCVLIINPYP